MGRLGSEDCCFTFDQTRPSAHASIWRLWPADEKREAHGNAVPGNHADKPSCRNENEDVDAHVSNI
jgi:hypothetical protein